MYPLHRYLISASLPVLLLSSCGPSSQSSVSSFVLGPAILSSQKQQCRQSLLFLSLDGGIEVFDSRAFDKRNESRKKFGLKPLTEDEFLKLQIEVREMEQVQLQKLEISRHETKQKKELEFREQRKAEKKSAFENIFGSSSKRSCQSNEDCEQPDVCCDMLFGNVCCYSGESARWQDLKPALVPVPQSYDWNS